MENFNFLWNKELRYMLYPGFVFWGLFGAFGIIVLLYILWMWRAEKKGN